MRRTNKARDAPPWKSHDQGRTQNHLPRHQMASRLMPRVLVTQELPARVWNERFCAGQRGPPRKNMYPTVAVRPVAAGKGGTASPKGGNMRGGRPIALWLDHERGRERDAILSGLIAAGSIA
jgi:hypothetical protein